MIDSALMVAILVSAMRTATPLILAALGELVVEKAGCVNLGVEEMMLVGAVTGLPWVCRLEISHWPSWLGPLPGRGSA